ncbi:MAG TPA: TonB-dependent receptor [Bacteroidia bacterium]|nr:TonB-dependent receptor [Bacteroidia bacterium]
MNRKNYFLFRFLFLAAILLQRIPVFSQDTIPRHDFHLNDTAVAKAITLEEYILKSDSPVRSYVANPGLTIEKPDSIQKSRYASGTLTDLLSQNGIAFLKSYGGGSLATTTIRGASASQTPVLWNGINMQSPTNGNVDLSLVPVILCDDVTLQNGGASAGWGSGAISGVIQAKNNSSFGDGLRIKYAGQAGSFGEMNHGIKISYGDSCFFSDVRVYRQVAKNNFTYRNIAVYGSPLDTLVNSDFLQQGAMGQAGWRSKSLNNYFTIRSWYQSSDRGIAPSMLEVNSNSRQKDKFFRTVADWEMHYHKINLEVKSAAFTEFLDFYPGNNQPSSVTHALSFVNEADCRLSFSHKFSGTFGINDTWCKADVTEYIPVKIQNRASAFAAIQYLPADYWNLVLNFRDEEVQGKITPLVGSFGAEWSRLKFLALKTSISRNYRIPTFNDLYWTPGGNPDLKPEDSWNEDGSVVFHYNKKNFDINYTGTAYYRVTKNWILWQPTSNSGIWSPENLLEVWSRGFEHRLKASWTKNKFALNFIAGYDYVRATNQKSKNPSDVSIGKQLPYVPANHFYGMLQITYRKFYLAYNHQFNGLRFTTSDHTAYLPAFDLADLTIGKRIDYKKAFGNAYGDLFFRVNNIFNKEYQAIAWRAMPGRNFEIGLTIDFNKPKKILGIE